MNSAPASAALTAPLVTQLFDADRRRTERADIDVDTLMCDREGRIFGLRVLNISETGFMGVADKPLCERDPVRLDLPMVGWLRAEIVWVLGERIGARFREPVEPMALARLVADSRR